MFSQAVIPSYITERGVMMGPDLYLPPMVECRDLKALTLDKSNPSDI